MPNLAILSPAQMLLLSVESRVAVYPANALSLIVEAALTDLLQGCRERSGTAQKGRAVGYSEKSLFPSPTFAAIIAAARTFGADPGSWCTGLHDARRSSCGGGSWTSRRVQGGFVQLRRPARAHVSGCKRFLKKLGFDRTLGIPRGYDASWCLEERPVFFLDLIRVSRARKIFAACGKNVSVGD